MSPQDVRCLLLGTAIALAPFVALGQTGRSSEPPRTLWGDPDLQGVWDYRTVTPLERPEDQADKAFLTEEEAATIERDILARNELLLTRAPERTETNKGFSSPSN